MDIKRVLRGILWFVLFLFAANLFFGPGESLHRLPEEETTYPVFEKNLEARLERGQIVVVDEEESDRFIHETLATRDYSEALSFARLKAEMLQMPLFLEDRHTFGNPSFLTRVEPIDRRAWQELILLELDLKREYARLHPGDLRGYLSPDALDPRRTPRAMKEFIDRYPESRMVAQALAYIEHVCCEKRREPEEALRIYRQLARAHPDQPFLSEILPDYQARAVKAIHALRREATGFSPGPGRWWRG